MSFIKKSQSKKWKQKKFYKHFGHFNKKKNVLCIQTKTNNTIKAPHV